MTQKVTDRALVPAEYYDIFALRMMGLTYKQIAQRTNKYTDGYIRRLFSTGNKLHDLYREWVDRAKKEELEGLWDMMHANAADIMRRRIVHAKNSDDPAAVVSSFKIFEYVLGDPKAVKHEGGAVITVADLVKEVSMEIENENKQLANDEERAGVGVAEGSG